MPFNFQFAFLGSGNNYVGRVMRVSDQGIPQEPQCIPETFGLPDTFVKKLSKKPYSKLFIFNIRGHDFLSHYGEWKDSQDQHGYLETSATSVSELALLEPLKAELEREGQDGMEMIIRFGPQASSFFVDVTAPGMERYKSHNLAQVAYGLDDVIQRSRDAHGYGDIREVMMNGVGGWVVLFRKGLKEEKFAFGGKLPYRLEEVLVRAQEAQAAKKGALFGAFGPKTDNSIHRIYLNHQNANEYVLLFNDGRCYASLHNAFGGQLESLVTAWAKGNELPNHAFDFTPSSKLPDVARKKQNASYYSKRGIFHLSKGNTELGLKYLREASREQENEEQEHDPNIERQLAMAILATRQERGAEQLIRARKSGPPRPDNQDGDTLLRNEYIWVLDTFPDIGKLKAEFEELKKQQLAVTRNGTFNEWSYDKAVAGDQVHEVESREDRYVRPEGQAHEMEGDIEHVAPVAKVDSHELSVEGSHSSREDGDDAWDSHIGPNGPEKRSKMPFKLGHRFKKGHGRVE